MIQFDTIELYKSLVSVPQTLEPLSIDEHFPKITQDDITRGYITRYFTRQVNHSNGYIYEINQRTYEKLKISALYKTVTIPWRISGKLDDVGGLTSVNTPTRLYTGVVTANSLSLDEADKELSGIKNRILNKTQFYVGY